MRSCGLKNVVYLLEDLKQIEHQSIPPKSLRQAIYNTQIVENFQIKQTATIKETCRYLNCFYYILNKLELLMKCKGGTIFQLSQVS